MKRSEIREHVFKLLFAAEFNEIDEMGKQAEYFYQDEVNFVDEKYQEEVKGRLDDILSKLPTINEMLEEKMGNNASDETEAEPEKKSKTKGVQIANASSAKSAKAKRVGWSVGRIGKIELTILRLAVYEIKFDDSVPTSVAIDEAVELAKKYGQDGAGSFVNGVLAKFAV